MRPNIDAYWISIVPLIARRATCPRRAVGVILVDESGLLVATGYNGQPPGALHCEDNPCPGSPARGGSREDCEALHAEANAIMQSFASRRSPWTMYCTLTPCFACAKLLLAAGIAEVVALEAYKHDDRGPALLEANGVQVWLWDGERRTRWRSA